MEWVGGEDLWLGRWVVERGVALTYLLAFVGVLGQFRPLLGEHGLLPAPRFLRAVPFRRSPSLFHLGYSDRLVVAVGWVGVVGAVALLLGLPQAGPAGTSLAVWLGLWALYLSVVNVGQVFYGFGWESLLLEAGFLVAFLGPADDAPPLLVMLALRWLLFRLELGAGLIKIRGDPCWRDLTCLDFHHETQPLPGPLSRWFHRLPPWTHRVEVLANHATQLVVPWLLFAPEPVGSIAALVMAVTQAYLMVSGNFSWLNLLTIVLALGCVDGDLLAAVLPVDPPAALADPPTWHVGLVLAVAAGVVVLSWWPVRNMVSRGQRMNASFNRWHLVNAYGAFGSVTKERREVVLEGTLAARPDEGADWREYPFKGKPGIVRRRGPQVAPYHLRLDWLMWFAALSPRSAERWLQPLLVRLLEADRPTLRLLARDPFAGERPAWVRARLYRYRYATRDERRATGAWWHRELEGDLLAPRRLKG